MSERTPFVIQAGRVNVVGRCIDGKNTNVYVQDPKEKFGGAHAALVATSAAGCLALSEAFKEAAEKIRENETRGS